MGLRSIMVEVLLAVAKVESLTFFAQFLAGSS